MTIVSTRLDAKQLSFATRVSTPARGGLAVPDTEAAVELSNKFWMIACGAILLLAAILRFYNLDLVPLHHDEGVNGNFLLRLVREGFYQYNPENYHGPTLYYFAAFFPRLLRAAFGVQTQNSIGLTTTAIRFVPALFGLGTVALIFALRKNLGTIATLSAAFFLAISPGAVYLSRYFIHESQFVFFTFAIVVALLKYYESVSPVYLLLGALSAGLLFATKETSIISAVVLVLALVLTRVYRSFTGFSVEASKASKKKASRKKEPAGFVARAGGRSTLLIWLAIAVAIFLAVNVLFYSSFFHNFPKGVWDSVKTFQFWSKTGRRDHLHPISTYVWWLLLQESPVLLLGAMGAALAVYKPTRAFALFSALWGFGLIAAYSLISYKTPWLALNFIVPLALCSGYAVEWICDELRRLELSKTLQTAAVGLVFVIVAGFIPATVRAYTEKKVHWPTYIPGYQTLDLNFRNYDNDRGYYVYVYAHTHRDLLKLLSEIDRIAQRTHQGGQTGITIVSPEYWPLPWYLRNYNRVGYHGRMSQSNEPIVIASQIQLDEVQTMFGDRYQQVQSGLNLAGTFSLRPGQELLLFTRRELVK